MSDAGMSTLTYHNFLAELLAVKKQESYVSTIAWIRTRVSFAILRSALVCLRGSRSRRRTTTNIIIIIIIIITEFKLFTELTMYNSKKILFCT